MAKVTGRRKKCPRPSLSRIPNFNEAILVWRSKKGKRGIRQTRKRWIDLFVDYGARVEVVYLEPPLSVILQQNERRAKPAPKQVIQHLVEKLEPPTWAEAHSVSLVG